MKQKLLAIFQTQTLRQSAITVVSTFLSSGLGAVYYLLLARLLGPAQYGLFSIVIAAMGVVLPLADLGLGQSLVRFVSANKTDQNYFPFVNLALKTKLASGAIILIIFLFLSSFMARFIFHQPAVAGLLPWVGLAVLGQILFFLTLAVFQGTQRFALWGGFQVGTNFIRLLLVLPLIFLVKFSAGLALGVFVLAYFLGFGLSLLFIDRKFLSSIPTSSQVKSFWDFNKWTAAVGVLTAVANRVDILLAARFLNLTQVGIYSLATIMVAFLSQLAGAIGAVTTAKFASFQDPEASKRYLGKAILFVGGISLLVALAMLPVAGIVIWFAGKSDYAAAWGPFVILLAGLVIFLFTNPIRDSLMYYHAQPQFFFWLSLGQAMAVLLAGWFLIPLWGVTGAALSFTAGQIFVAGTSVWYYRKTAYA